MVLPALSPAKEPPGQQPPDEDSNSPEDSDSPKSESPGKWTLTKEALDKLLTCFSPDREEAGRQLELVRARLILFFERVRCPAAEELVDKTIDTVARRIDEGEIISNRPAYFRTVAKFVFMEWLRRPDHTSVPFDETHDRPADQPPEDDQRGTRLRCLDKCLADLSAEKRKLVLEYYSDVKREKINHRRELAQESTMNALRIRTCRIRKRLEKCVKECLKRITDSEMNLASHSL